MRRESKWPRASPVPGKAKGDAALDSHRAHCPDDALGSGKKKFRRLRIPFPIEIRDGHSVGTHRPAKTQDIGGKGCYIETMQPLPVKQILDVTFWLNSERIQTTAIVRTCDGGVGMGIEFIGLDEATQNQLQEQVEALAAECRLLKRAQAS